MAQQKFTNNAVAALSASINSTDTTVAVASGQGALFPSLSSGDYFYATIIDSSNNIEIVKVTARSTDSLTVVRGQEGTTGRSFTGGDNISLRLTAAGLSNFAGQDKNNTFSGTNSFSGPVALPADPTFGGGALPIASGGTGQVTANTAFNALAPAQTTAAGKYLKSDGTNTAWDQVDLSTSGVTGTLPVLNGGTGSTTATGTGSVVLDTSPTLKTPTIASYGSVKALFETATITANSPAATTNYDIITQAVQYYTSNTTTNFTLNIRGDNSTTLNSILGIGQSVTCTLMVTNGTTAYYPNVVQVDGTTVTPKWQTGNAPVANYVNAVTIYTFSIIKTASATFTVLGSQVKFA